MDDASAWIVLAIVLASLGAGAGVAITAICGAIAFVLVMTLLMPRLLAPLARAAEKQGKLSQPAFGVMLGLFMLCAFAMDIAGLHAVFGGFILGVVTPRGVLTQDLRKSLEPFVVTALLPVFFCYSGLNTQLTMVNSRPCAGHARHSGRVHSRQGRRLLAAARLTGQDNSTALGIGALMNARGLMEFIIINIGLQRGD